MDEPLTIFQADIKLFLPASLGPSEEEQFIGGCAEKVTLSCEYEQRPIEYPGVATRKRKKVGENHVIEITNLWLLEAQDSPVIPDINPDTVYKLEIEWTEEDTFYRAKRTYTGVTLRGDKVDGSSGAPVMAQNLTFDAESRATEAEVPA